MLSPLKMLLPAHNKYLLRVQVLLHAASQSCLDLHILLVQNVCRQLTSHKAESGHPITVSIDLGSFFRKLDK